jgi:uncharacterized protein (DUF2236 family)
VRATISQRVNAERVALLGWSRAILLQFAHPLIAAGVADHSTFRGGPFAALTRLHHTLGAMRAITFGDDPARQAAIDGIMRIHRRIRGELPRAVGDYAAGTPYSAEDPDLVLWVHATLLDSLPIVHDLIVEPVTAADRDAFCDEAAAVAIALGARPEEVPRTWNALRRYLDGMYASGRIVVSSQARELAAALLVPPVLSAVAAPAQWANKLIAVGLLPALVREQYGFAWPDNRERRLRRALLLLRAGRSVTPDVIALWADARRPGRTPLPISR